MEHPLADKELVGHIVHRVGGILADDQHPVVLGDFEQGSAGGDFVAEVAGTAVVAQGLIPLGRFAHVDFFEGDDLGAPRKLVAVFCDDGFEEVGGVGDDVFQVGVDFAQAGPDFLHLLFGAVDIV